jgi:hypothetical protein
MFRKSPAYSSMIRRASSERVSLGVGRSFLGQGSSGLLMSPMFQWGQKGALTQIKLGH